MKTWQQAESDTWVFGEVARGIVRGKEALIFFHSGAQDPAFRFQWRVYGPERTVCGYCMTLADAATRAEQEMGISGDPA